MIIWSVIMYIQAHTDAAPEHMFNSYYSSRWVVGIIVIAVLPI